MRKSYEKIKNLSSEPLDLDGFGGTTFSDKPTGF